MAEVRSPTVRRRELGALLRALRNEKGLTVEQVAEHLLCSTSKVSRMETGHGVATQRDIRDLCNLYGVTDKAERDRLMTLSKESRQPAWWQSYDLVYDIYAGLEAEAVAISAFQSSVIHGLLQTADYARAGHLGAMPRLDPGQIDLQIEAKLTRQRVLTRENPPRFHVVLDEAALHREVGGRSVMAEQLARILQAMDLPNVAVQVLPYDRGSHPAVESNFNILALPDPAPGVVFVEGLIGSTYLERPEDFERYREIFGRLQSIALGPQDTADLIAKLSCDYRKGLRAALRNTPAGQIYISETKRKTAQYLRDQGVLMSTDAKARTLKWRKASYSAGNGACIEVAPDNGQIAVRDSRKPDGAWLHYPAPSWHSFIQTIKGE